MRFFRQFLQTIFILTGQLFVTLDSTYAQQINHQQIRTNSQNSIVFIITTLQNRDGTNKDTRMGTGFIVSKRGHIITSSHVVLEPKPNQIVNYKAAVRSRDNSKRELKLISRNEDTDLALLLLPDVQEWQPISIGNSDYVENSSELFVLGFPKGRDLSGVNGIVSNQNLEQGLWQTNVALNKGNSGGPVFDKNGTVVAIVKGGDEEANEINLIIPMRHVLPLIELIPSNYRNPMYCRHPSHGFEDWKDTENWFVDSGWTYDQISPEYYCKKVLENEKLRFSEKDLVVLVNFDTVKGAVSSNQDNTYNDQYKSWCWFRRYEDMLYKLGSSAACQ